MLGGGYIEPGQGDGRGRKRFFFGVGGEGGVENGRGILENRKKERNKEREGLDV